MIRIFKTEDGTIHEKQEMQPGSWIALTNPTASEIIDVADACRIDPSHCERIHLRTIFEPFQLHVDAVFCEKPLLVGDLPGGPARPVAVTDAQYRFIGGGHGSSGVRRAF